METISLATFIIFLPLTTPAEANCGLQAVRTKYIEGGVIYG